MENLLKELNNILDEAEIKANKIKQLAEERIRVEEYIFNSNARTREISEEVDREVAGVEGSFIFLKRNIGKPIRLHYINY